MPSTENFTPSPRKELDIFYVLDTSGSMAAEGAIGILNRAMEETTEALSEIAKKNGDAKLKVAVMEFSTEARWITENGPEDLEEDFVLPEELKAGGLTSMGAALNELNKKLSRDGFLHSMMGALMPVIIFMTDGHATDDYTKALAEIRQNKWFTRATKIGFAIRDDADVEMLSSVVGNSEAVIRTTNLAVFAKLMKFVSVTSSMLVSSSRTTEQGITGADIVKMAQNEEDMSDAEVANLRDGEYDKEAVLSEAEDTWDDDSEW